MTGRSLQVKSINLDSWTMKQAESMRTMGNAKAKEVYEAHLPEHFLRPQSERALENFIRAKYEERRFSVINFIWYRYATNVWVPPRMSMADGGDRLTLCREDDSICKTASKFQMHASSHCHVEEPRSAQTQALIDFGFEVLFIYIFLNS